MSPSPRVATRVEPEIFVPPLPGQQADVPGSVLRVRGGLLGVSVDYVVDFFGVDAGALQGRSVSAYPACAPEVRLAGGEWVDVPMDGAHADGNLVTAPAWPAHPAWIRRFLEMLGTRIEP